MLPLPKFDLTLNREISITQDLYNFCTPLAFTNCAHFPFHAVQQVQLHPPCLRGFTNCITTTPVQFDHNFSQTLIWHPTGMLFYKSTAFDESFFPFHAVQQVQLHPHCQRASQIA